uniref:HD domain-containing protein n=1 Tax=Schlesneria paludicola TaxID=360056 RepID=A0A7C4QXB6_9PLAN
MQTDKTDDDLIARTEDFVRQRLRGDSSGHDWWHVDRVRRTALVLAQAEGADPRLCELAALLHDIADWKFHGGDVAAGPAAARSWLESQAVDPDTIQHVCDIIAGLSFRGAGVATDMPTLEGRCVQDADRLDAIGAIGIARAFAFGGQFGRPLYDPDRPPAWHATFADYQRKSGPTINHFYEKLLLLKDRMQTDTGRRLAEERHRVLEQFLAQFFAEWYGGQSSHQPPGLRGPQP